MNVYGVHRSFLALSILIFFKLTHYQTNGAIQVTAPIPLLLPSFQRLARSRLFRRLSQCYARSKAQDFFNRLQARRTKRNLSQPRTKLGQMRHPLWSANPTPPIPHPKFAPDAV